MLSSIYYLPNEIHLYLQESDTPTFSTQETSQNTYSEYFNDTEQQTSQNTYSEYCNCINDTDQTSSESFNDTAQTSQEQEQELAEFFSSLHVPSLSVEQFSTPPRIQRTFPTDEVTLMPHTL